MLKKSKRLLGIFVTLALALSLTSALTLTATAKDYEEFTDESEISEKYMEAVRTISALNILNNGDVLIGSGTINSGGIVGEKYIPANNGNYGIIVDNSGDNSGDDIAPYSNGISGISNANTSNNHVPLDSWYYGNSSPSIEDGTLTAVSGVLVYADGNARIVTNPGDTSSLGTFAGSVVNSVDTAHRAGIKSDLAAVNSVVLGSQGVNTLEMISAYSGVSATEMWLGLREERNTTSGSIPGTITTNGGYNNVSSISGNAIIANGYGATISAYGGYNNVSSISNNAIIANGNGGAILNGITVFTNTSGRINALAVPTNRGTLFVSNSGVAFVRSTSGSGDTVIVGGVNSYSKININGVTGYTPLPPSFEQIPFEQMP